MIGVDIEIIRAISILKDKGIIPKSYDHTIEILAATKKQSSIVN